MTAILRELLDRDDADGRTVADHLGELLIKAARRGARTGDAQFMKVVLDRAYGKVPDVVEGSPDRPLKIVVEYVDGSNFGDPTEPPAPPPGAAADRPGGEEI